MFCFLLEREIQDTIENDSINKQDKINSHTVTTETISGEQQVEGELEMQKHWKPSEKNLPNNSEAEDATKDCNNVEEVSEKNTNPYEAEVKKPNKKSDEPSLLINDDETTNLNPSNETDKAKTNSKAKAKTHESNQFSSVPVTSDKSTKEFNKDLPLKNEKSSNLERVQNENSDSKKTANTTVTGNNKQENKSTSVKIVLQPNFNSNGDKDDSEKVCNKLLKVLI